MSLRVIVCSRLFDVCCGTSFVVCRLSCVVVCRLLFEVSCSVFVVSGVMCVVCILLFVVC